ncbi:DUF3380 domain-containing protein [Phyllobacterium salinisoli]|uniref:DUF3380 domain-containing protein n=1 Tax=Phyllobacterium salinisoli TaxID=1899321 RepID=A0A368K641_9HYPH|nr:N-acetylmuramidase family protein [Phyllobacterium salinisoli]RCS23933.1 DUF3380 domain-containing protein [Phyllobacterium salinisoli]
MFETQTIRDIIAAARQSGVEPSAILAVAEVESGGRATARINGSDEPLIRFEGHYFDRRLTGKKQAEARQLGLAAPKAGSVKNPATQAERWRLLARAARIDRNAAHESVSWGLGQVMGAHWQWLEYVDVQALVAEARGSVAGQIRLMLRFIERSGLVRLLNEHDWAGFARRYNGPLYRQHAYDRKMAAAWKRWRDRLLLGSDRVEKKSASPTYPS